MRESRSKRRVARTPGKRSGGEERRSREVRRKEGQPGILKSSPTNAIKRANYPGEGRDGAPPPPAYVHRAYFIYVPYANTRSILEPPRVLAYERRIRTFAREFTCSLVRSLVRGARAHIMSATYVPSAPLYGSQPRASRGRSTS